MLRFTGKNGFMYNLIYVKEYKDLMSQLFCWLVKSPIIKRHDYAYFNIGFIWIDFIWITDIVKQLLMLSFLSYILPFLYYPTCILLYQVIFTRNKMCLTVSY